MDAAGSAGINNKLEPKRMVGIAYVVFAFTAAMFFGHILAAVFNGLKVNDRQLFGIEEFTISNVLGFALAIGIAVFAWTNHRVHELSLEVASELKKVTWPSLPETRVSTVAVVIATVVSSLILFFYDFLASKIMTVWLPGVLNWLAKLGS